MSLTHDRADNGAFWASHTIDRGQSTANGSTSFAYPLLTLNGINLSAEDDVFSSYSTNSNRLYRRGNDNLMSLRRLLQTVDNSSDGLERDQLLEEQAISGIEMDLAEWASGQSFSADDNYWFAGFELKASGVNNFAFARASLGEWSSIGNNGTGSRSVPPDADGAGDILRIARTKAESSTPDETTPYRLKGFSVDMITRTDQSVGFLLGFRDDNAEGCSN